MSELNKDNNKENNSEINEKTLSKEELKAKQKEERQKEKAAYKEARKIKRGKKALHLRKTKNFIFFLTGMVSAFALIAGGVFAAIGLVPVKTYTGANTENVVSEKLADKTVLEIARTIGNGEYKVKDVPVFYGIINSVLHSAGMDAFISVNDDSLKEVAFDSTFGEGILASLSVSSQLFGDMASLEIFDTVAVPDEEDPSKNAALTEFNPKLYYVLSIGTAGGEDAVYARAYNDDGTRAEGTDGQQLYYLALDKMNVSDMTDVFTDRFRLMSVKSVLKCLGGVEDDSLITDILGDNKISEMSDFGTDDIKLSSIIDLPTAENEYKNKKLYDVLLDATSFDAATKTYDDTRTYENILLSDLSGENFNINNVRLIKVLDAPEAGAEENVVLKLLRSDKYNEGDPVRLGNLDEKINGLSINDMYEVECMTKDVATVAPGVESIKYKKEIVGGKNVYSRDDVNGEYYISTDGRIWTFLLYELGTAEADGFASSYTDKSLTFSSLKDKMSGLSGAIMDATIAELYASGIISTKYDKLMTKTVNEVMSELNNLLP